MLVWLLNSNLQSERNFISGNKFIENLLEDSLPEDTEEEQYSNSIQIVLLVKFECFIQFVTQGRKKSMIAMHDEASHFRGVSSNLYGGIQY